MQLAWNYTTNYTLALSLSQIPDCQKIKARSTRFNFTDAISIIPHDLFEFKSQKLYIGRCASICKVTGL